LAPVPGAYLYRRLPTLPMVVTSGIWVLAIVFILTRPGGRWDRPGRQPDS
jgi:hypothetical protein